MKSETKTIILAAAITASVALFIQYFGKRWLDKTTGEARDRAKRLQDATEEELEAAMKVRKASASRGGK